MSLSGRLQSMYPMIFNKMLIPATLVLLFLWSCSIKGGDKFKVPLEFDHARFAIFSIDSLEEWETPLSREIFKAATLEQSDFAIIDRLFAQSIFDYNKSFEDEPPRIDVTKRKYKMQLVCVMNPDGEREVWVNCFCTDLPYWREQLVEVNDGWTCFFNLRVNLTTNMYSHFEVNGAT
jgi:hypothetical protein